MLPLNARKKLPIQMIPTDRQLWAIGVVVVQWSGLELTIKLYGHALTEAGSQERAEFDSSLRFKRRLRNLRALVENKIMNPWRGEILDILDRIGGMQQERDNIVHRPIMTQEVTPDTEEIHTAEFKKGRAPIPWGLTFKSINALALKIAQANQSLLGVAIRAAGKPTSFLLHDALQRICRKPDQNP